MKYTYIFLFWLLFLAIYLYNITNFPVFEDEGQYLLLADQIAKDPVKNFYIYLQNGLFPLYGYIVAIGTKIFGDSLVVARITNVILASSLIFWINNIAKLFKLPVIFTVSAVSFIIISPILIMNTRVALLDIPVMVFTAWYLYVGAKLIYGDHKNNYVYLFLLFLFLCAAFLIKPTGFFGLPAAVSLMLLSIKEKKRTIYLKVLVYLIALAVTFSVYFAFSGQIKNDAGSSLATHLSLSQFVPQIKQNIWLTYHWSKVYYSPFLLILLSYFVILPFYLFKKQPLNIRLTPNFKKFLLVMIIWTITSLIIMITLNRFYYPRHILLITAPLVIIMAFLTIQLPRVVIIVVFTTILILRYNLSYEIITNPSHAAISLEDKFQYFEDYTSGTKIKEITNTLRQLAGKKDITVWLDGSYVLEYGLRRQMKNSSNILFKSFRLNENFFPHEPRSVFKDGDKATFAISNRWIPPNVNQFNLVESFKVSFRHSQNLYEVK